MSAVGTTLLQSPGWNEGKARYVTLGKYGGIKIKSSVGAALLRSHRNLSARLCRPLGAQ